MLIRPTEASDFGPIAELTNHFIRETAIHFGDREQSPEELRAMWEGHRDTHPWFTATLEDGAFAGFAKCGVWRERTAYQHTVETAIYMHADARGKGMGRRLYGALLDDLRARGFHVAVAGATLPNEASVRLHEAVGFSHVATFKQVGWKFDRWHNVAFFQLMLT